MVQDIICVVFGLSPNSEYNENIIAKDHGDKKLLL